VFFLLALSLAPVRPAGAQVNATQSVSRLQNFGTLVAFLNLASGTVRIVAILEPSAASCDPAVAALKSILEANASKRLRAYVVWTHSSELDTELRALSKANELRDRRLVHFWDGNASVSDSFRDVLGSGTSPATGVVLLYDTDARLALEPPAPSMWMSANPKLAGAALDASRLGAEANEMVRRVEAKVSDGTTQNR
jgi:hypothetical protein